MQEENWKETDSMGVNTVEVAQEAEALKILRMLDRAIADGKDITQFQAELGAYVDGKLT
ncbi:hypothetical protein LJC33_06610 [Eubacteriales bacterium OttesenSCG-928-N13]|nr:hypothetical protein [Eubacteriales bacterium OttesenSCG-928-N13]